jgi:hypothetical protein
MCTLMKCSVNVAVSHMGHVQRLRKISLPRCLEAEVLICFLCGTFCTS